MQKKIKMLMSDRATWGIPRSLCAENARTEMARLERDTSE
jgi:hypothetical protein